jgi:hypothetical protein
VTAVEEAVPSTDEPVGKVWISRSAWKRLKKKNAAKAE